MNTDSVLTTDSAPPVFDGARADGPTQRTDRRRTERTPTRRPAQAPTARRHDAAADGASEPGLFFGRRSERPQPRNDRNVAGVWLRRATDRLARAENCPPPATGTRSERTPATDRNATAASLRRSTARAESDPRFDFQPTLRRAWPRECPRPQYAFKISMFNVSCNSH